VAGVSNLCSELRVVVMSVITSECSMASTVQRAAIHQCAAGRGQLLVEDSLGRLRI
jgi:hypothetical protein